MANGHSVIPIDDSLLAKESIQWLQNEAIYVPTNVPKGRFPTLAELRHAIHEFGYQLEETHDWYVTSDDDHTEIWFKGERSENAPTEFWFRRGDLIVLDIMQSLANQCGSVWVIDHSGAGEILIVPNSVFGIQPLPQNTSTFVAVIMHRMPTMIERLRQASLEETLLLISQIHNALKILDYIRQHELFQSAQQGLPVYIPLLKHTDARVRYLAFDLITRFEHAFYDTSAALTSAIKDESIPATKARMIWEIEHLISGRSSTSGVASWIKAALDTLLEICNDTHEMLPVRFAAATMLARSQPGILTPEIRAIFIDALVQPNEYNTTEGGEYSVSQQTLETIKKLMLHHRFDILLTTLPRMTFAQDAHDVLRALLDYVFFGEIRLYWMTSLIDDKPAERPPIDEARFRNHLSQNWLYPANPTKLTAPEILPFQREILETIMALEIPWMVHSNLLEKYGLPVTRAATKALLNNSGG